MIDKINNSQKGFTLIELMITVVVIAILSAIAIPAYREYLIRAQTVEGIGALSDMRVKMEQYFQDNRTYTGACQANTLAPLPTNLNYFTLTCTNITDTTYTITATSSNFTYTVDQSNNKNTTILPQGWTNTNGCWVISKTGQCA